MDYVYLAMLVWFSAGVLWNIWDDFQGTES